MRKKGTVQQVFGNTVKNVDMISIVLLPRLLNIKRPRYHVRLGGSIRPVRRCKPNAVGKLNEIGLMQNVKEVKAK